MSGQHWASYNVKRETVYCYQRNVDRCCTWSEVARCCPWNLSAFSKFAFVLFCYMTNHLRWFPRQSWKTTAHASLATQSVGKYRLKQQIPNVKSITERWRYFVDFLQGFESFYFPKRFIYLRGIASSGPHRWNFWNARDFVSFIDPLLCIVASRAAFSLHGLLTSQ